MHFWRRDIPTRTALVDALDVEQRRGEVEFLLRYRRIGMYGEALREYQSMFDPSYLMILFYEDFAGDDAVLWSKLCTFLNIDTLGRVPPQCRLNQSGQPGSRLLQYLLKSYRLRRVVRSVVPYRGAALVKEKLDSINLKRLPALDGASRVSLQQFYREDIEEFSRLTGRDLKTGLA